MDRDIRRARRRAVHGDVNAATRALAGQLRAGRLSADALELPAALGYEPALRLLTPDRIAFVGSLRRRSPAATRAGRKLISKTAHFGYEAVLRGGVALVHAVRERFPAEAQRDPAGLTAPWLTGCLDAVEDAVCYGEGELRDRAVELDTLANNAYLDDSLSALVANLEAAGCWATLSLLALVGTAQRGGYFRVGKIGDLARDSVEHYAFKALREQLRLSKPKVEAEALAILRRELVSWALGEGDPLRRRHPEPPPEEAGGCANCGAAYEVEGWGGERDRFCSTECYLEGGDPLGGAEQIANLGEQQAALRTKRAEERRAHTRAYFRGESG